MATDACCSSAILATACAAKKSNAAIRESRDTGGSRPVPAVPREPGNLPRPVVRDAANRQIMAGVRRLLNHLVRPQQQRLRDREAERFRGLEIDHELKLRGCLDGQLAGIGAPQYLGYIDGR